MRNDQLDQLDCLPDSLCRCAHTFSFPNYSATFELTSTLLYSMDFFLSTDQKGDGKGRSQYSFSVNQLSLPLFHEFLYTYQTTQLVFNQAFKEYSTGFVTLQGKKLTFFSKNFTSPISVFLFIVASCYVDQCEPRNRVPLIISQFYVLLES